MDPKILIFSPSSRKVWIDIHKALNPSYFIIAYLAARLGDRYEVYTIDKSFSPVGKVKHYTGQPVDCVVSIGASYNPATLKAEFNKGFAPHDRAFEIAYITQRVFNKYKPLHVNLCVDVRKWFDELNLFGPPPDIYITEQEMGWQAVGYMVNSRLGHPPKRDTFFFSGGVKSRQYRFKYLTQGIKLPKIIHGGGWSKHLDSTYACAGFTPWVDSVKEMLRARYSLTLHEELGNQQGWVTAKLFENFGARVVTFVDAEYDRFNMYVPEDYLLRVDHAPDCQNLINLYGYDRLLMKQNALINPKWADLDGFYVIPFLNKFQQIWDAQRT